MKGDPPGDLQVSGRMGGSMGGQESSVRVRRESIQEEFFREPLLEDTDPMPNPK